MPKFQKLILTVVVVSAPFVSSALPMAGRLLRTTARRCCWTPEAGDGREHAEEVDRLDRLGGEFRRAGDLPAAERAYRQALAVAERELAPADSDRASSQQLRGAVEVHGPVRRGGGAV